MRHLQKVHNSDKTEISDLQESIEDLQENIEEFDLSTVEAEFQETQSSSAASISESYDPIYESFQLKPGTVVEIIEFDGQEIHQIDEITT